jgi:hypothetical protein
LKNREELSGMLDALYNWGWRPEVFEFGGREQLARTIIDFHHFLAAFLERVEEAFCTKPNIECCHQALPDFLM